MKARKKATRAGRSSGRPGRSGGVCSRELRSSRSKVVLGALVAAMGTVGSLLYLIGPSSQQDGAGPRIPMLLKLDDPAELEPIYRTRSVVAQGSWDAIVIHHSGSPVCTPRTIAERHRDAGLNGLGFHFVLGNGRRTGDGEIYVSERWLDQVPGAHVAGPAGPEMNRSSIGICLVGNGNRQPFTRAQLASLAELIGSLRTKLGIPEDRVFLHRDVAPTESPGKYFPAVAFGDTQIANAHAAD